MRMPELLSTPSGDPHLQIFNLPIFENLSGGWIRSRDIVGEVQNGAQTTPVVGAERERGHAPGELPGE